MRGRAEDEDGKADAEEKIGDLRRTQEDVAALLAGELLMVLGKTAAINGGGGFSGGEEERGRSEG